MRDSQGVAAEEGPAMTDTLVDIPTLDSLAADPRLVKALPAPVAEHLLIQITSLLPLLIAKSHTAPMTALPGAAERFLTVEQVIAQYGVTERWLYRHKRQLPHSQPSRKVLLFPEEKLRRWFSARKTGG
jgi:hypothetical protein